MIYKVDHAVLEAFWSGSERTTEGCSTENGYKQIWEHVLRTNTQSSTESENLFKKPSYLINIEINIKK